MHDTNDMMIITVHHPDPEVNFTNKENVTPIPVDVLPNISLPVIAVAVFSTPDTKSVSLVSVENLSISNPPDNLILQVKPHKYYDGKMLTPYIQDMVHLQELDGQSFNDTGLFLEMTKNHPVNLVNVNGYCPECIIQCHRNIECINNCIVTECS